MESEYKFVKPKVGLVIRDPATSLLLPAEGKKVKMDKYWLRLSLDGDVTISELLSSVPSTSTSQSKKEQGE